MTDTTERAELLALADRLTKQTRLELNDLNAVRDYLDADSVLHHEAASALRRLAAQDHKPVAWHSPTDSAEARLRAFIQRLECECDPYHGFTCGKCQILSAPHASGCAKTPLEIAKANGLVTCLDETGLKITSEIYKACTDLKADACLLGQIGSWGDTLNDDDVLSGLKSYNEMGECFVPDRLHASDCDKQGCMGDMAPGDPKDLAELLAKPSVLEPSDRAADVTGPQPLEAQAESNRATDAYGMWRR